MNDPTWTVTNSPLVGTCKFPTTNNDVGTLTGLSSTGGAPVIGSLATLPSENGRPKFTWEASHEYTGATSFDVAAT